MEKQKQKKGGLAVFWVVVALIGVLVASTFNAIKNNLNLGLDLRGGFEILYQVEPLEEGGSFDIVIDGDLFKAIIEFNKNNQNDQIY